MYVPIGDPRKSYDGDMEIWRRAGNSQRYGVPSWRYYGRYIDGSWDLRHETHRDRTVVRRIRRRKRKARGVRKSS